MVVWVTNKRKLANFVKEVLFPSWQVACVGEWHWIKVRRVWYVASTSLSLKLRIGKTLRGSRDMMCEIHPKRLAHNLVRSGTKRNAATILMVWAIIFSRLLLHGLATHVATM